MQATQLENQVFGQALGQERLVFRIRSENADWFDRDRVLANGRRGIGNYVARLERMACHIARHAVDVAERSVRAPVDVPEILEEAGRGATGRCKERL